MSRTKVVETPGPAATELVALVFDVVARHWIERVTFTAGGCWLWAGPFDVDGYGIAGRDRAHRLFYRVAVGPVPDGLVLDHLCRVRRCVNPTHLEPVTAGENVQRGKALITHCPQGHAYTPANTYVYRTERKCRACMRDAGRRYRARKEVLTHG